MRNLSIAFFLLVSSSALAQSVQPLPPLRLYDEGTRLNLRFKLNCVGAGIICADDATNKWTTITVASASGTVASIVIGTGLASTQSPLTTTGTMSVDQTFSPTWSGTHTFNNALTDKATTNQLALGATGHVVTISSTAPAAAAQTLTIPDTGGADTFAFLARAQTWTGIETFGASPTWGTDNTYSFGDTTHRAANVYSLGLQSGASQMVITSTLADGTTSAYQFNAPTFTSNRLVYDFRMNSATLVNFQASGRIVTINGGGILSGSASGLLLNSATGDLAFFDNGGNIVNANSTTWQPATDAAMTLGTKSLRWTGIFGSAGFAAGYRGASSTVTVATTDFFIGVSGSGARTVNLPAANTYAAGQSVIIVEIGGSTGLITINPAGSDNINGANTAVTMATAYGRKWFISDGSTNWYVDASIF